jgi:hypothetical protein
VRRGAGERPFAKTVKFGVHNAKFVSCVIVAPKVARLLDSVGSLLQKLRSGSKAGLLVRGHAARRLFRLLGRLGCRRFFFIFKNNF